MTPPHGFKPKKKTFLGVILICLITMVPLACSEKTEQPAQEAEVSKTMDSVDEIVLARVNGSAITQEDLNLSIERMFDRKTASFLEKDHRKKILESLVMSRAVAQKAEAELGDTELAEIDRKVRFYREELLVRKHIGAHSTPAPVTEEQITSYYKAHPEQFGAKQMRSYEMLSATRKLSGGERDNAMDALSAAGARNDWEHWARQLRAKGYPVVYRQGVVSEKLDERLVRLLDSLSVRETSPATFIEGTLYIARVIKDKQTPPRPLDEVRSRIREMLAPVQVKKAIKNVGEEVLKSAEVEYESR